MQNIEINHQLLERVAKINLFTLPQNTDYILFGVRGGLPTQPDNYDFAPSQTLRKANVGADKLVDYKTFCCTIGIWNRKDKTVAVFPASTVPHTNNIAGSVQDEEGTGCNQLFTGYYHYFKGVHRGGSFYVKGLRHYESNKGAVLVCRRLASISELSFGMGNDIIGYVTGDNFHPAYTYFNGGKGSVKGSHGCQIIAGYPAPNTLLPNRRNLIPVQSWLSSNKWKQEAWVSFQEKIYSLPQDNFNYMLLTWKDYMQTSANLVTATPRYGSSGEFVNQLKKALQVTNTDSIFFRNNTLQELWKYQSRNLDVSNPDDYLNEFTAQKLGIILPKV
jgi:hypothetical protein